MTKRNRLTLLLLCLALAIALLPTAVLAAGPPASGLIALSYSHRAVRADLGETLTLTVRTDLNDLWAGDVRYEWYENTTNYFGTARAIPGATKATYTVPTGTVGTKYYYCIVQAVTTGGEELISDASDGIVRVDVRRPGEGFDAYNDGMEEHYISYDSTEDFSLGVGLMGYEGKDITCQWYKCDKDGFIEGESVGDGLALLIYGIPEDMMMIPIYYKCMITAMGDKTGIEMDEVIVSAILYPMGVEEPEFPFTDVPEGAWYYESVNAAYQMGLINGTSATTFSPNDNCTRAQIVTFLYRLLGE